MDGEIKINGGTDLDGTKVTLCRDDSAKTELLPVPENGCLENFIVPNNNNLVDLTFHDLSFTVAEGIFRKRKKILLDKVNGKFDGGKLTALMGPSGAGKSTLINILSGYSTRGVTGTLCVNNEVREERTFKDFSCYIMQDDKLQPLLTVLEAMTVSANLKLSTTLSSKEKLNRVKEILQSLNLWSQKSVQTLALSGGQRKRLSLALELVNDPQVIFLDEPTSGLDSLTSKQCIKLLRDLAQTGRTVICSIHQPSAIILDLFDQLYVLAGGKCIYQGAVRGLVPYLEEVKLTCPPYHNPADYVIEVAIGEHGNCLDKLVKKSENGINEVWKNRGRDSAQISVSIVQIDALMSTGKITPVHAPNLQSFTFPAGKRAGYDQPCKQCLPTGTYPTTFFYQLRILLKRAFTIVCRDKTLSYNRIFTYFGIGALLGLLCYGIGEDGSRTMTNFNLMFFSVMFLVFTAFNSVVTTFPSEMSILSREYFNKWYCLKSYYIAISVADIPIQMCATIVFATITYGLTKQPLEMQRVAAFFLICILLSLTAQAFGLCIGACMDLKNAVIFGPFFLCPFTIFSGFFVKFSDCPEVLRWMFHLSFLKYGFEGLILSVFGYDRSKLPCYKEYCHFVHPKKLLQEQDMDNALYSTIVIFLISLMICLKIAGYFALKVQIKISRRK